MKSFSTGIIKKNDNLKFKEALNRELMKNDVNSKDYKIFHETVLSILMHMHFIKRSILQQIMLL